MVVSVCALTGVRTGSTLQLTDPSLWCLQGCRHHYQTGRFHHGPVHALLYYQLFSNIFLIKQPQSGIESVFIRTSYV